MYNPLPWADTSFGSTNGEWDESLSPMGGISAQPPPVGWRIGPGGGCSAKPIRARAALFGATIGYYSPIRAGQPRDPNAPVPPISSHFDGRLPMPPGAGARTAGTEFEWEANCGAGKDGAAVGLPAH